MLLCYSWKGDSVGYRALYQWVNVHKPKPLVGLCEFCNIKSCEHLACVTYNYTRDFGNWKYLCSKCHNREYADFPDICNIGDSSFDRST